MAPIRRPCVAGTFYPASPETLRNEVRACLRQARGGGGEAPRALIVPHAGYAYSGPVAGSGYARLGLGRSWIRRVVLVGPSHRVAFRGMAVSDADGFATPLGVVPLDKGGLEALRDLPHVRTWETPHECEHSLEVQLPFLQEVLEEFTLVPVVVGQAGPQEVVSVLARLWDGPGTAVVVSSDLSHYLDQASAQVMDRATTTAILNLRPEDLEPEAACGSVPVRGLLLEARRRGLAVQALDVRTSGETTGARDRVVGYGAYAFH